MTPRVLVCPVAYNEHVKLRNVIERFLKSPTRAQADYVIVDDGSDDGTTEMIVEYQSRGVGTIKHPHRSGVGAAIRTAIASTHQLAYHAGGGIVADSIASAEYEETLLKARTFFAAVPAAFR